MKPTRDRIHVKGGAGANENAGGRPSRRRSRTDVEIAIAADLILSDNSAVSPIYDVGVKSVAALRVDGDQLRRRETRFSVNRRLRVINNIGGEAVRLRRKVGGDSVIQLIRDRQTNTVIAGGLTIPVR